MMVSQRILLYQCRFHLGFWECFFGHFGAKSTKIHKPNQPTPTNHAPFNQPTNQPLLPLTLRPLYHQHGGIRPFHLLFLLLAITSIHKRIRVPKLEVLTYKSCMDTAYVRNTPPPKPSLIRFSTSILGRNPRCLVSKKSYTIPLLGCPRKLGSMGCFTYL